jgi:hypothetical protein
MMQNKFVQKKPPEKQKKKIGDSISWCCYRQSCVLTITPPQRQYWEGRIKLYINQIYVITIIHREFTLRESYIKYICQKKYMIIIIKSKGTTKNRKFWCVVYMSNELISKIIWLFLFGYLFCFLYFLWIVGIILKYTLV